jgi:hypothetical protein
MNVDINLPGIVMGLGDEDFGELVESDGMIERVVTHAAPFYLDSVFAPITANRDDIVRKLVDDGDWVDDVARMRAMAATLTEMAADIERRGADRQKRGPTR